MKKLPDGTAELSQLPHRKDDAVEGDELADEEANAVELDDRVELDL